MGGGAPEKLADPPLIFRNGIALTETWSQSLLKKECSQVDLVLKSVPTVELDRSNDKMGLVSD